MNTKKKNNHHCFHSYFVGSVYRSCFSGYTEKLGLLHAN